MVSAASPILASALFNISSTSQTQKPASSGSFAIDTSALEGGYRYGEITSIAGPKGTGKTLLGYHAIASHLLEERDSQRTGREAALIDTMGGFSAVRLRDVLVFRLRARWGSVISNGDRRGKEEEELILHKATQMLAMVRVMRVFDLVGVMEALGEIGEKRVEERSRGERKRKLEVEDSEDEEEDCGEEHTKAQQRKGSVGQDDSKEDGVGLIVIDSIANVASSVISQSPMQGQALLTSSLQQLHSLVTRHQICAVLINSASGLVSSSNSHHRRGIDDNVSIFASSFGKPTLGKAFAYLLDTSVFLSLIPKMQDDAAKAYGNTPQACEWSKAIVLEVLKDKKGSGEGRWVAFEIVDSVKLVACFI